MMRIEPPISLAKTRGAIAPPTLPTSGASVDDILSRWQNEGAVERFPTGWPTFDEASRGGLMAGRVHGVTGAPNAGKTALIARLAHRWSDDKIAVAIHNVDETPVDFLTRLAQLRGVTLEDCEARSHETIARIAAELRGVPLRFYDHAVTIEEAARDFEAWTKAEGITRSAYLVDSLQTVSCDEGRGAKGPRERIDSNVRALSIVADRGPLVIATSEMARAFYANSVTSKDMDAMASAKESGSAEYAFKTIITLRSVKGDPSRVLAKVPKMKRGRELEFYLHLDRVHSDLFECDGPPVVDDEERDASRLAKNTRQASGDAEKLASILAARPGIGEVMLRAEASAKFGWGRERLQIAKAALGGRLENRGPHARATAWFLSAPQVSDAE